MTHVDRRSVVSPSSGLPRGNTGAASSTQVSFASLDSQVPVSLPPSKSRRGTASAKGTRNGVRRFRRAGIVVIFLCSLRRSHEMLSLTQQETTCLRGVYFQNSPISTFDQLTPLLHALGVPGAEASLRSAATKFTNFRDGTVLQWHSLVRIVMAIKRNQFELSRTDPESQSAFGALDSTGKGSIHARVLVRVLKDFELDAEAIVLEASPSTLPSGRHAARRDDGAGPLPLGTSTDAASNSDENTSFGSSVLAATSDDIDTPQITFEEFQSRFTQQSWHEERNLSVVSTPPIGQPSHVTRGAMPGSTGASTNINSSSVSSATERPTNSFRVQPPSQTGGGDATLFAAGLLRQPSVMVTAPSAAIGGEEASPNSGALLCRSASAYDQDMGGTIPVDANSLVVVADSRRGYNGAHSGRVYGVGTDAAACVAVPSAAVVFQNTRSILEGARQWVMDVPRPFVAQVRHDEGEEAERQAKVATRSPRKPLYESHHTSRTPERRLDSVALSPRSLPRGSPQSSREHRTVGFATSAPRFSPISPLPKPAGSSKPTPRREHFLDRRRPLRDEWDVTVESLRHSRRWHAERLIAFHPMAYN